MTVAAETKTAVPDDVAKAVMLAESHSDEDKIYKAYAWLRENAPVGRATLDGFDPVWLISKHADIMEIERNPELFPSAVHNPILNDQASDQFLIGMLGSTRTLDMVVYMDPPEHGTIRSVTAQWFMPRNLRTFEDRIRSLAKGALAELLASDGNLDFVKEFTLFFPLHVIMTLLGVPEEDEGRMLALTQELFGVNDPDLQRDEVKLEPDAQARMWMAAVQDFYAYFGALTVDRRAKPSDDLLSLIANARGSDGEYLSDSICNGYYVAIATAGHDTTSSSIATAIKALAENPAQLAAVKADPSLINGLVDEAIRWSSPVKHFMRSASEDTTLRGVEIKAGERLMLCYPSGNRDTDVFENPDVFDLTRKPNKHIAFGYGPHMCLGQHVAKLEMRILFEELLPHLEAISLTGQPKFAKANFVGGLVSLPVSLTTS